MKGPTLRQQQVLDIIERSIREKGYPPTTREIRDALGVRNTNGVTGHLHFLALKGLLVVDPMKSRGIRLLKPVIPKRCSVDRGCRCMWCSALTFSGRCPFCPGGQLLEAV